MALTKNVAALATLLGGFLPVCSHSTGSPSVQGRWLSEDGNGVIEIAPCAEAMCGKLVWIANPPHDGSQARDRHNPDPQLRQRPICGLTILGSFHPEDEGHWSGGWIYSPQNGKTYRASLTLENADRMKVRGYIGLPLFGQSQTWTRADPGYPACGHG